MSKIKQKHLNKTMNLILNKCSDISSIWSDDTLTEYCNDTINKNALYILKEQKYIKLIIVDGDSISAVMLSPKGLEYFLEIEQKRKEFIKNFFAQFLTGFISGSAVTIISTILLEYINQYY